MLNILDANRRGVRHMEIALRDVFKPDIPLNANKAEKEILAKAIRIYWACGGLSCELPETRPIVRDLEREKRRALLDFYEWYSAHSKRPASISAHIKNPMLSAFPALVPRDELYED